MLYIFIIIIAIASITCSIVARKKIGECSTEEEKKSVKARWQLICSLLGVSCILVAGILIFTMF